MRTKSALHKTEQTWALTLHLKLSSWAGDVAQWYHACHDPTPKDLVHSPQTGKNDPKCVMNLNVKPETIKRLDENQSHP